MQSIYYVVDGDHQSLNQYGIYAHHNDRVVEELMSSCSLDPTSTDHDLLPMEFEQSGDLQHTGTNLRSSDHEQNSGISEERDSTNTKFEV